ncbi:MAG: hypothetical protein ED557_08445 [Balneola sp.]|nr:MAG: hypothetical protein ED557_08445 [Balneola sp.]
MLTSRKDYIIVAVAATVFTIYNAVLTSLVVASFDNVEFGYFGVFLVEGLAFLPLGISLLIILWISRRRPEFFSSLTIRSFLLHVLFSASIFVIHAIWQVFVNSVFFGTEFNYIRVERDFMAFLEMRYLCYITMIGIAGGVIKARLHGKEMVKESELKLELQRAKMSELELKLNPEIIYPNLLYIKEKTKENSELASQMVISMAGLLRKLVDNMERGYNPLMEETKLFELYSEILKLRKEVTLNIKTNVSKLEIDEKVPPIILLIPLIEELIFGKYTAYLNGFDTLGYQANKIDKKRLTIALRVEPISTTEGLLEFLEKEPLTKVIEANLTQLNRDSEFYSYIEDQALVLAISSKREKRE